jgi:hypothetical protein
MELRCGLTASQTPPGIVLAALFVLPLETETRDVYCLGPQL